MTKQIEVKQTEIGTIPEDWEIKELGAVCSITMGQSPPSSTYNIQKIGLPFFQGRKDFGEKYPMVTVWCSEPKKIANNKEILLSVRAPIGDINIAVDRCCIGRGLASLSMKNNNNEFLYYLLTFNKERLKQIFEGEGTVFGCVTKDGLNNFDIFLPSDNKEQRAIASILGSLDDKIALNRSMNSTLEAIGQALFRRWFVDFEFPDEESKPYRSSGGEMVETELGEVPRGWRVGRFADLAEINKGDIVDGPFGSNLKSSDYTDFGVRLIHQENIKEFNFINEKQRYTSFEKAAELQRSVAFPGDIVMTKMPEPITRAARIPHNISKSFIIMADCIRVRPNPELTPSGYLLYLINSKSFRQRAEGLATGTTRSRINLTQVKSIKIVIPPENCRKAFGMFSESLESLREKNSYEISILSSIRDALLPKLMSGEVRIEIPMSKKKVS